MTRCTRPWSAGSPQGLAGEQVAIAARISDVANQAVIFDLDTEPGPVTTIGPSRFDEVAATFADMVDLKRPFTLGHSSGVAELAAGAAQELGMGEPEVEDLRRESLLHDLGRVAVSSGIWEKPKAITTTEREQVRLHAYQTERILARSPVLAPLGRIAGLHHERLEGSGYHRGCTAGRLPTAARLQAVADVFQAMTQARPHRPACTAEQAAEVLARQAAARRLDADHVRAVIEVAGQPPRRVAAPWPAGPTDREVEVLRLVAAGRTNRQIAEDLIVPTHRRASRATRLRQDRQFDPRGRLPVRHGTRPHHAPTA